MVGEEDKTLIIVDVVANRIGDKSDHKEHLFIH